MSSILPSEPKNTQHYTMNISNYYHGEPFPCMTEEEAVLESDLNPAQIQAGKDSLKGKDPRKVVSGIKIRLGLWPRNPVAESELYGFVSVMIKIPSVACKSKVLLALEKLGVFELIRPETAFALSIKCVRANDPRCLQAIIRSIKSEHAMHQDLTQYRVRGGETLGHLAARCDHVDILRSISLVSPESLMLVTDDIADTIAHTACRYGSSKCIEFIDSTIPVLFTFSNRQGITPRNLVGEEMI